jgi:lipoprotein NlpD
MKLIVAIIVLCLTACSGGRQAVAPIGSFGSSQKQSITSSSKKYTTAPPSVYRVKRGDTLYSISWRYGMNYKTLANINNIRSPYNIYVGQKLVFKSAKRTTVSSTKTVRSKTSVPATTSRSSEKVESRSTAVSSWLWPTKGKVTSSYASSATGRNGISISGQPNQAIIAAAAGKVVYSGNGLPRYGNLLIIKHNETYLSAYAHNKSLLLKEGDYVKAGQKIATMGRTGTQTTKLHFEIRKNGKPVDPVRFLPKR